MARGRGEHGACTYWNVGRAGSAAIAAAAVAAALGLEQGDSFLMP